MRVPTWLCPLAARLDRIRARRAAHRPAFRPRVEGLESRSVPAVFTVTTTADSGAGSLRQAIDEANLSPGTDSIVFALPDSLKAPGADWWTIHPASALPMITGTVALDGWTQGGAGYHGPPRVMLDGTCAGPAGWGLGIDEGGHNTLVRGLAIGHFPVGHGVSIGAGVNSVSVQGCYIGLDPSGGAAAPNQIGVRDLGVQTLIGGSGPCEGNVISGNTFVNLTSGGTVRGNFIGTNAAGTAAIPNAALGVSVGGISPNGVASVLEGNVISGFGDTAIIAGAGVRIRGNLIGTDATGMQPLGNGRDAISVGPGVTGTGIVIGGTRTVNPVPNPQSLYDRIMNVTGGDRNVISANAHNGGGYGIRIQSGGVVVQGNYIGTPASGVTTPGFGNVRGIGVGGADACTIGGPGAGEGNLIAGNSISGIDIVASANSVVRGNVIRDNQQYGITVGAAGIPQGNTISENSIYGNGGLGIDLLNGHTDNGGVTLNDSLGHSGANRFQNFPDLAAVTPTAGGITVTGSLIQEATPDTNFRIEFFANTDDGDLGPDGFRYGEGKRFLGSVDVMTDANGIAPISKALPALLAGEGFVTATATNLATGDTSEFSRTITPPANTAPVASGGGPYTVVRGGTVLLDASGTTDPEQPNTALTYQWDFDGDGEYDDATGMAPTFSAAGLDALGNRTVGLRVTDGGGLSATATATVQVVAAAVLPDPVAPGTTALFIGGTSGHDLIIISPSGGAGALEVCLNGVSLGVFQPTGRVVVYGQAGNDVISATAGVTRSVWIYGGAGNDLLKGGSGPNVLLGGDGIDLLVGGSGRDVLIGGLGADLIVGNPSEDILIAGTTAFDGDPAALAAIQAEWTSTRDFATRIANLSGTGSGDRLNGTVFLRVTGQAETTTVYDDGSLDVLTGGAGQDWLFANLSSGGVRDLVTDLSDLAFANDLAFIQGP